MGKLTGYIELRITTRSSNSGYNRAPADEVTRGKSEVQAGPSAVMMMFLLAGRTRGAHREKSYFVLINCLYFEIEKNVLESTVLNPKAGASDNFATLAIPFRL
jgi:hypothetical protein